MSTDDQAHDVARLTPWAPGDLNYQKALQDSQWWPADRLARLTRAKLHHLIRHAVRTVPLHRQRLQRAGIVAGERINLDAWPALPPLTRKELQERDGQFESNAVPSAHGPVFPATTSGSTGIAVTVKGTAFDAVVSKGMTLRFALWHPHDFTGKFAFIRRVKDRQSDYPAGSRSERWADTATFPFATGPSLQLSTRASVAEQAEWLKREDPDYLSAYPSLVLGLAEHCHRNGITLPRLEHVSTLGEVVNAELRQACWEAWDVPVIDAYSAQEVCEIAFQCPEHEHYHVLSESIYVEVVDATDNTCAPGEIGRVLVTPLHNYATPLLRYELGDYAEVGPPCPCGRGLPVLKRILGRERNSLLVTGSGERYWPSFGTRTFRKIAPIVQHQFVQKTRDMIEARFVTERPLTLEEEARLREHILSQLPSPFVLSFDYPNEIPRNPGGKFETFISIVV
jgi:phenylacetate-coenzyme A ligase PaaK-like adenylate-forming protein